MATKFQEIRDLVRAIVADSDSQNFLYANETIDQHIKLIVMTEDDAAIQTDDDAEVPSFTTSLPSTSKALMAYKVAQSIIAPNPDYFAYKSPVLTVTRGGGTTLLLAQIQKQLDRLQGGFLALHEDNELWAFVNGPDRWDKDWADIPAH
jgi:hypothetical protein